MKTTYLLFCCLFAWAAIAQTTISDDFSDGNFSANPKWIGDTAKFKIDVNNQLQLNDLNATGIAYLSTKSTAALKASWQFYVRLDFNPSGSNFAKVYLLSSQSDLTQALNGYFVRIGGQSGTADDVRLYRQDGSTEVELINGSDGTVGFSPELLVKVTRDSLNNWELSIDTSSNLSGFVTQGTAIDFTYSSSNFMGVYCDFTSTRSDKFYFDDFVITGEVFQDTVKPQLTDYQVIDSLTLQLTFSELLSNSSATIAANYQVNKGIGAPNSINYVGTDSSSLMLTFSTPFQNGEDYELSIQGIQDRNGNSINTALQVFSYFVSAIPSFRDVQINEFYPDFSPSNGLPEVEYIELYNASNKIFDLENWKITDGNSISILSSVRLDPGEYLIICAEDDTLAFSVFGNTLGLGSLPTLNNNGDSIRLLYTNNQLIDELYYELNSYKDESKEDGGWSIEQINPKSKCLGPTNYRASVNAIGGTPGQINSVFDDTPDLTAPELLSARALSADIVKLLFNEVVDTSSISIATYRFSTGNIVNAAHSSDADTAIVLVVSPPLDSGKLITITIEDLRDCSGNLIGNQNSFEFILPERAEASDLVINEVLFNPRTGGDDFVELYNRSNKILSLKGWAVNNTDRLAYKKTVINSEYLVYPNQYVGLTENINNISANYPLTKTENFIEVTDLPSFNNDVDTVILIDVNNIAIDRFDYTEDMHFELLNDDDGVSLERINPDGSSKDPNNFHSAAESVGFATPGFENSQYFKTKAPRGKLSIDPKTFSPDNDGLDDVLSINYQFDAPGYVANVTIYDRNGRQIKKLVNNELLGKKGNFIWDGISDDNQKARIGIYVLLFEAFNIDGDKEVFKLPVVIAGFLD